MINMTDDASYPSSTKTKSLAKMKLYKPLCPRTTMQAVRKAAQRPEHLYLPSCSVAKYDGRQSSSQNCSQSLSESMIDLPRKRFAI